MDINRNNYGEKAFAFIKANGGKSYFIAAKPAPRWRRDDVSPREYRCWIAYLRSLGLNVSLYRRRGYLTAPAQWPNQFDPRRTREQDQRAALPFRDAA